MNILLLMDMASLWNDCKAQYGKRARVNFKLLIEKAKKRKTDVVLPVAFVAIQAEKNQENLIKKLTEMEITTVTREFVDGVPDFQSDFMEWYRANSAAVEMVVLASSSTAVVPTLQEATKDNKQTMLLCFGQNLNKQVAQFAEDIRILTKTDTVTQ